MKPLVYVAGPVTGDPWGCVRRATDVARQLAADGIDCLIEADLLTDRVSRSQPSHQVLVGSVESPDRETPP